MLKPNDADLNDLCRGVGPKETHYDGSPKFSQSQTKLVAALWLHLGMPREEVTRMVLVLDRIPSQILETVASELTASETKPATTPTLQEIASMCWAAMKADDAIAKLRLQRRKTDLVDE